MGKPFSRRDNYIKHLRQVHGAQGQGTKGAQEGESGSEDGGEYVLGEDEMAVLGIARNDNDRSEGKRKVDDLGEGLDELSREDLLLLLLQTRQKYGK
jgi:hypothetical protein